MEQPNEVGDWIQISILGAGAFGIVMLWRNQKNSEFIAIKKCKFEKASTLSDKQKERWHMEVDFLKSINHPNIIGFKKLDPILAEMINKYNHTKLPLLSMEYCKKGNLRRYLTSEPIKLCGLPEQDVRYILKDISSGLKYLHSKKITHRDIKPDNIVLQHCDKRKGNTIYKIIDLGYAKELQDSTLSFVGTLHYLAPEIFHNQDYCHSIDYWSMGVMVFEITCGILPFLPELTPFERFEKLKNKGPDDICIYMSYSGSIANSTEIKNENFVTGCFKQNIEAWLKRVLQMNPSKRAFSNISVFDYLSFILDKKIVKVFSLYKQEFYSYEINSSTLFSTLKDWISRDIRVPRSELLFLFRKQNITSIEKETIWNSIDDNTLLEHLISDEDVILYVYEKESVLGDKCINAKMPNLVKELFSVTSNFQMNFAKHLYRQALFFVYSQLHSMTQSKHAYLILIEHIKNIHQEIESKYFSAISEFGQLLSKVGQFTQKRKNSGLNVLNNNDCFGPQPELCEYLKHFERVLCNIEKREANLKDFGKQYKILRKQVLGLDDARQELVELFGKCDIQSLFDRMNGRCFLEKPQHGESPELILKRIKDVISETVKHKFILFVKEDRLRMYLKNFSILLKWSEDLLSWARDFISIVQKHSSDFDVMEEGHYKIIAEDVKSCKAGSILCFDKEDAEKIIKENELLRCQFTDLLSQQLAAHKDFLDASGACFDSI